MLALGLGVYKGSPADLSAALRDCGLERTAVLVDAVVERKASPAAGGGSDQEPGGLARASSAADLATQSNHLLRRASSVSSVGAPSARVSTGVVELDSKLGQQRTAKWLRDM